MGNPLLLARTSRRRRTLRKHAVEVPTDLPTTDALFLLLRRMRQPLVALIVVFTASVCGLAAMPGVDGAGQPYRMTLFEAFYVMSYTATTIGFGEIPYTFTTEQRLWVTGSIYATVIAWAWAIGTLLALVQEESFRDALASQRFRRKVSRIREPFHIIAGYGEAGVAVAGGLDRLRRRFVVVEKQGTRVDRLATEQYAADPAGLEADATNPAALGLAGLDSRYCEGVLALTASDAANLAVVQAVNLLKPKLPVIARCGDREVAELMAGFGARAVINPYDRYGDYLVLGLQRPVVHQVMTWLLAPTGTPLDEPVPAIPAGRWIVSADGTFREEISRDLRGAGYEVIEHDPSWDVPDLSGAVGFVAGSDQDTLNLALGARVRRAAPEIFLALRQSLASNRALYEAFDPDSIFVATDLVARECFARIVTPRTWAFLEQVSGHDDEWATELRDRLIERVGTGSPVGWGLTLDQTSAPAVVRWLEKDELTIADLLRHPADRDQFSPAVVLAVTRDGRLDCSPGEDLPLKAGDELLIASVGHGYAYLRDSLFNDASVEYAATGRVVPSTWVWRQFSRDKARA